MLFLGWHVLFKLNYTYGIEGGVGGPWKAELSMV